MHNIPAIKRYNDTNNFRNSCTADVIKTERESLKLIVVITITVNYISNFWSETNIPAVRMMIMEIIRMKLLNEMKHNE